MIVIRDEQPGDLAAIREVNLLAFGQDDEGSIVDALRAHSGVTLSMVAVEGESVVGHILYSPLSVADVDGVALGPMAVKPSHQRQGIGSRLVEASLERLLRAGCPFVVLIGHPNFYPRFGFQPAADLGLVCEWEVPAEVFMVKLLNAGIGTRLAGLVKYRPEFSGS